MRRIEPAFLDLFPVTHVLRPGYLPGPKVSLDPLRMGIAWEDAPLRVLPSHDSLPRQPVRALAFARVAAARRQAVTAFLETGGAMLVVIDDPSLTPADVGVPDDDGNRVTGLLPVLPSPLADQVRLPDAWSGKQWGAVLGLFPFPGAAAEAEQRITALQRAGATFAVAAPLLLTPKDRHRILDGCEGAGLEDRLENSLFHADVSRGLHALERRVGVTLHTLGMEAVIPSLVPRGFNAGAIRTSARLRLWARRLDQCYEESSWGWRLRRAAAALEPVATDPHVLAEEDNLRVIPGFDPWVESFTRSLWDHGEPWASAWLRWSALDGQPR